MPKKIRPYIVAFFSLCFPSVLFSQPAVASSEWHDLDSPTIEFTMEGHPGLGYHSIYLWLDPIDDYVIREIEEPIPFSCTITISRGKKTKEKKFAVNIERGLLGISDLLFVAPFHFAYGPLNIVVKDIVFEDRLSQYYSRISFSIIRNHYH